MEEGGYNNTQGHQESVKEVRGKTRLQGKRKQSGKRSRVGSYAKSEEKERRKER